MSVSYSEFIRLRDTVLDIGVRLRELEQGDLASVQRDLDQARAEADRQRNQSQMYAARAAEYWSDVKELGAKNEELETERDETRAELERVKADREHWKQLDTKLTDEYDALADELERVKAELATRYEETTQDQREAYLTLSPKQLIAEIAKYRNMLGRATADRDEARAEAERLRAELHTANDEAAMDRAEAAGLRKELVATYDEASKYRREALDNSSAMFDLAALERRYAAAIAERDAAYETAASAKAEIAATRRAFGDYDDPDSATPFIAEFLHDEARAFRVYRGTTDPKLRAAEAELERVWAEQRARTNK